MFHYVTETLLKEAGLLRRRISSISCVIANGNFSLIRHVGKSALFAIPFLNAIVAPDYKKNARSD